jgi:tetratricopeptide (TPR) repeat protein
VNGAINALNADKLDSAEYLAKQADRIYSLSPYGTMVLGTVYNKRNDNSKAVEYWTKAAESANKDTAYRDVRRQMLANVGNVYMTQANTLSGAEKVTAARKAADTFGQLLAVPGTRGSFVSISRQSLQTAYLIAGDTAAAAKSWNELAANPSAYEYQDLLNSAVNAARGNRVQESGKLFEATLAANPFSRDALYNVAVTYLTLEQNEKVGPIVTRLVDVDPGNPENFNLAARAYLSMAKVAQNAKNTKLSSAYNDSTVQLYNNGNKLPIEVTFREFSPTDKQVTIAGTVLDRRDKSDQANTPAPAPAPAKGAKGAKATAPAKPAPKMYPPQSYTLTFSALDKAGNVVGTETVTSASIQPGQTDKFSVKIQGANIAAYRYKISQ